MREWKRKISLFFIPLTLTLSLGRGNRRHFCVGPVYPFERERRLVAGFSGGKAASNSGFFRSEARVL
jgi:hypothetical protein